MKVQITRNLGMLLLAIWLIITGLVALGLNFPLLAPILGILAIAAGILILIGR